MSAWARQGEGNAASAAQHLEELAGPDWYGLFTAYHQGLIEEQGHPHEVLSNPHSERLAKFLSGNLK